MTATTAFFLTQQVHTHNNDKMKRKTHSGGSIPEATGHIPTPNLSAAQHTPAIAHKNRAEGRKQRLATNREYPAFLKARYRKKKHTHIRLHDTHQEYMLVYIGMQLQRKIDECFKQIARGASKAGSSGTKCNLRLSQRAACAPLLFSSLPLTEQSLHIAHPHAHTQLERDKGFNTESQIVYKIRNICQKEINLWTVLISKPIPFFRSSVSVCVPLFFVIGMKKAMPERETHLR